MKNLSKVIDENIEPRSSYAFLIEFVLSAIIADLEFGYDLKGNTHDEISFAVEKIVKSLKEQLERLK